MTCLMSTIAENSRTRGLVFSIGMVSEQTTIGLQQLDNFFGSMAAANAKIKGRRV